MNKKIRKPPVRRPTEDDLLSELQLPDDFGKKIRNYRTQLIKALDEFGARNAGGQTAMQRVAQCFFEDKACMVAILQHLLPRLKSVKAKVDSRNPLSVTIGIAADGDDSDDDKAGFDFFKIRPWLQMEGKTVGINEKYSD